MQNLQLELIKLLEKDEHFTSEGKLLKNKVIEAALQLDPSLIKLLLTHKTIKKHFFKHVEVSPLAKGGGTEGVLIFDKIEFQKFVSNKSFLKDSYTAFSNKIGLTSDDVFISESKEVVLSWPHKDCVLEGGQTKEDEKRDEIFWNETLAPDEIDRLLSPKVFTNFKKYDSKGEHKLTDISLEDNLIIKGNNLLALHSLLPVYGGQVKLIYIAPPYNTEEDEFMYNDTFDHSTWLTFIKNRVFCAKELLSNDGLIFIQINDIEYAYLKVLLDEIFGRDCFQSSICVKMAHLSGPKMAHKEKRIPKVKEHILVYSKKPNGITLNPQFIPVNWEEAFDRYENYLEKSNSDNISKWSSISLNQALKKYKVDINNESEVLNFKMNNSNLIFQTAINRSKDYPREPKDQFLLIDNKYVLNGRELIFAEEKIKEFNGKKQPSSIISDIWTDIGINNVFQEGGREISLRFGKKPEMLLKRVIALTTKEDDLVMDFFLGTGTSVSVAHKMKRKYIGIEQLDYGEGDSVHRIQKVISGDPSGISKEVNWKGGGSFVYCELGELNKKYISQIKSAKTTKELKQIWVTIKKDGFISYNVNPKDIDSSISEFEELSLADQKKFLIEVLDKNHLYLNYSEIDDKDYKISDEDKKLNKKFYSLK